MTKNLKHVLTVREVIEALEKVEDKKTPCCVWINSQDPEVIYEGGSRIPIVHVDDIPSFNVVDMCCEELEY